MNSEHPSEYASALATALGAFDWSPVEGLAKALHTAWSGHKQLFLCGNGGSAANAIHIANDFIYGIGKDKGLGMKVTALPANAAIVTCLGNDLGYETIFSRQLAVLASPGDILIALSGSGNSPNILRALEQANSIGMETYAILGYSGGKAMTLAGTSIHFAINDMQISEDLQMIVGHMLMKMLARRNSAAPHSNRGMSESKIIPFDQAAPLFAQLRAEGKRIVQCHGTFDLMHPGHVVHLEEAKGLGDVLVVTVTAEKYVNKGPGRPCFNDAMRARTLAALACVDYVVLIPHTDAIEAIRIVRPHYYCKGREYQDTASDVTGNIHGDIATVEECGGEIRYIGSVVFSSTKLLNRHFDYLSSEVRAFCRDLGSEISPSRIRDEVERFRDLKILVIGDTIIDQYTYLKVQGLTSKNRIISGRYLRQETYTGGALAALRHVKQFCDNVRFISLLGEEPWVDPLLAEALAPHENLTIRDPAFTTVVKKRYVEPLQGGTEMSKLFSVNFIDAEPPKSSTQSQVLDRIRENIRSVDAVLLLDFGHGLMQAAIRECVQEEAPFLVVNCQTNSNNHGYNIITRQYERMDAFSLDQQEIMLACGARDVHFETELQRLKDRFGASYAWLTRGVVTTIGLKTGEKTVQIPPLETDAIDTVGAGDAFFSVAGLAAARRLPANLSTFLGQIAGAQAVKIVGNARPISKSSLLKSAMSLLSF